MKLITPDSLVRPSALTAYEEMGNYCLEPKIDGSWCELRIEKTPRFISSGDREFASGFIDKQITSIVLPNSLLGTRILCELETHTAWSTKRRASRGHTIAHLYAITQLRNKDIRTLPYQENRKILEDIHATLNDDVKRFLFLMLQVRESFVSNYTRFKNNICWEGAVLKRLDKNIVPQKSGRLKGWIKVKDFPNV
jgi:hypothetical protein